MIAAVIMAGGYGERFWPRSRKSSPKQCLPIFSAKPLIQETVERFEPFLNKNNVFIVTSHHLHESMKVVVPDIKFILEPMRRDSAAAIGLATIMIEKEDPNATLIVVGADYYITEKELFQAHLKFASELAQKEDKIITIGIEPTRPATGFGYIHMGEEVSHSNGIKAFEVQKFVEKPNLDVAKEYIASGKYKWNSGMFIFRIPVMMKAFKKYMPELYSALNNIKTANYDKKIIKDNFTSLKRISIDFGVMEKTKDILMVRGDFHWDDVGDWTALERFANKDKNGNIICESDLLIDIDNKGCIFDIRHKKVAALGLRDIIVVETDDVVMICPKNRAQDVKKLASLVQKESPELFE